MSQSGSNGRGRGGGWKHNNRGRGGRWRGHGGQRGGWKGGGGWRGGRNYNNSNSRSNRQSAPLPQVIVELVQTTLEQFAAFKGWRLYFPTEVYSDTSPIVKRVKTLEKYFRSSKELYSNIDIETQTYFTVDFKELLTEKMILDEIPDMSKELTENPETVINCFGLAMHQILATDLENDLNDSNEENSAHPYVLAGSQVPKIHCRLVNVEPIIALKNLKANYYGKFVTLKGTVIRVNNIKPLCTQMAFECQGCGRVQAILLPEGKYMIPTQCPAAECRSRTFIPLRSHHLTLTVDWQTIRIQEIMNDEHRESGRIPRTVDCELTNDLVDSCTPGDMVTLSGIVKVQSSDDGTKYRQRDKCMFLMYIDANSVTNAKGKKSSNIEDHTSTGIGLEFTTRDFYSIENVQSQRKLFRLIVGSLCPSIFGHELVKAGLVLGLFGGTQKFANDKNRVPVRGDPHILVVGDPGLGKSQLLMAVTNVAPRSVYVCGNTTTTSGLTVTLSKEGGGTGDYSLEAGALVLADQGVCCIDEFDKMGQQHQALLEAMEQQSISIAKAGIVCSLPARTSILAAANPVGGHYDQSKTVSENLRMGSALLSRFDLVFIILDKPDEDLDSLLSEHVMTLHCGKKRTFNTSVLRENDDDNEEAEADKPLLERLKIRREEPFDPIPHPVLRKYIAYARRYVHPKISPAAAKVLQEFYLDLRRKHQTQDSTPITTRQLESLIRLTEARARVELREETTEQDAVDVIDIMKDSMVDTQLDAMGFMDFSRSQHGSGMSKTAQVRKMTNLLQQRAQIKGSSIFSVQDMKDIAREGGVKVSNFEDLIMNLNVHGHILSQGPRIYKLIIY